MKKLLSLLLSMTLTLFSVSASIALPILWRGFYDWHIKFLQLPSQTGWSAQDIRTAYNEMMDFCLGKGPFGTGAMKWSQEGMRHFADVGVLFRLDLRVLACSTALLGLLWLFSRYCPPHRFFGKGPSFYAGCAILLSFGILTVLAALDFDRAFVVFHHLFFPGKTNWIFDYRTDEIILVLPQVFFRNCAILTVSALALFSGFWIFTGLRPDASQKKARSS